MVIALKLSTTTAITYTNCCGALLSMKVTINFKAKAGDKVLARNPRRNGKLEYFTIKYLNYLNFGTHERIRYEALTCRETKNGKINVIIDDDDILEVCL